MTPIPTLHLRFVERDFVIGHSGDAAIARTVKVLQQFWQSPNGKEVAGDMFNTILGEWRDVPNHGREQ
jgi:hypothetical protein